MGVVVLCQRREQREAHLAHTTHKRLLLHLHTLVLQEVRCLVKDLQALRALERAVLAHHALVLMWISQMRDVMAACAAFVASFAPHLQRRLLRLMLLLLAVLLAVMLLLLLLLLLRLQGVRLQHDAIDGASERVLCPRRDGVDDRRWRNGMLLPCLGHPRPRVRIQLGAAVVGPLGV